MIKNQESLTNLTKSDNGTALIEWLDDQIRDLDSVSSATPETFMGRKEAVKILKELFSFLIKVKEPKEGVKKTTYE